MESDAPRPRITRVWARNFRSIESLDLEFGDLTVLVGRNGVGKSNTVDVLRFLKDCVAQGFEQTFLDRGGVQTIRRAGSHVVEVGVGLEGDKWQCRYSVKVPIRGLGDRSEALCLRSPENEEWTVMDSETLREINGWNARFDQPILSEPGGMGLLMLGDPASWKEEPFREWADRMTTPERASDVLVRLSSYDFNPPDLRLPQRAARAEPLDEHGQNLVAVLRSVLSRSDGDTLRQSLRALVDGVQDIEVQALGGHLIAEIVYGGDGAAEPARFDLGLESDGTIRLVAILAALYQSPPRTLTVIEEPERNIHPGALAVLADVIKEASTRGQVLITTHSPDLIDHFSPDDIRVVERVDGATVVGRMEETQREIVREKLFTTGELMRVEGLRREGDG